MAKIKMDETREHRISMEIVVDAYNESERAIGWYYYLEDKLNFPFLTECKAKREISPLRVGDEVKVIDIPSEEECEHEMFVTVKWKGESLAVPLSQLQVINADDETREVVEDWHYWVDQGYIF